MVRESPSKSASNGKNVSFRSSSLMSTNNINQQTNAYIESSDENKIENQRIYRSLSPSKKLESFAYVIGQQPNKAIRESEDNAALSRNNKNVYFAQAIGQSRAINRNKSPLRHVNNNSSNNRSNSNYVKRDSRENSTERILEIHTSPIRKDISKYYFRFLNLLGKGF